MSKGKPAGAEGPPPRGSTTSVCPSAWSSAAARRAGTLDITFEQVGDFDGADRELCVRVKSATGAVCGFFCSEFDGHARHGGTTCTAVVHARR